MATSLLDKAANVAVIICCGIFSVHLVSTLKPSLKPNTKRLSYEPGDRIADTDQLGLKQGPQTLLLITRSGCHFCSASMPFYQTLMERAKNSNTRVVALTMEDPEVDKAYLVANNIHLGAVLSTAANGVRAAGTPTLVLVRQNGAVVKEWDGQLSKEREGEVLGAVAMH